MSSTSTNWAPSLTFNALCQQMLIKSSKKLFRCLSGDTAGPAGENDLHQLFSNFYHVSCGSPHFPVVLATLEVLSISEPSCASNRRLVATESTGCILPTHGTLFKGFIWGGIYFLLYPVGSFESHSCNDNFPGTQRWGSLMRCINAIRNVDISHLILFLLKMPFVLDVIFDCLWIVQPICILFDLFQDNLVKSLNSDVSSCLWCTLWSKVSNLLKTNSERMILLVSVNSIYGETGLVMIIVVWLLGRRFHCSVNSSGSGITLLLSLGSKGPSSVNSFFSYPSMKLKTPSEAICSGAQNWKLQEQKLHMESATIPFISNLQGNSNFLDGTSFGEIVEDQDQALGYFKANKVQAITDPSSRWKEEHVRNVGSV